MRVKCIVSYDGTNYNGYQVQPSDITIQGEIEKILMRIHKGQKVGITASGRTDAGVHAIGQVFHFDTELTMNEDAWKKALNAQLPKDIQMVKVEHVQGDFHSRYDAKSKKYEYRVQFGPDINVFNRLYWTHYPFALDFEKMKEAARYLEGTHDFTTFSRAKAEVEDRVRTIYSIEMEHKIDQLIITFHGNGFLYNMVRIMVGTLLEVGRGKYEPNDVLKMLENQDRASGGKTAPAHGLYLKTVYYE